MKNQTTYRLFSFLLVLGMALTYANAQAITISGKVIDSTDNTPMFAVRVAIEKEALSAQTDETGFFQITDLPPGSYEITFFQYGYRKFIRSIEATENVELDIKLSTLRADLKPYEIVAEKDNAFGITTMRSVEGFGIYAAKKSEVVVLEDVNANKATNNSRQVYAKVAGLNIWESDGGGLQLGIGSRGLSPNRTSNFNTRQNGYDISADALGYPESYYTPPTEAIEKIQVVRGAASLQYGTQFGGMLNFKLKQGPRDKPFELVSRQTVGSFNLFSSFNSIGGTNKRLNYYAFYQHKQGDGWRDNAGFESDVAYARVAYQVSRKVSISGEYTWMQYLAQQPGGLTDVHFENDPRQSIRDRNWFSVDWNLVALNIDYRITDRTALNSRTFGLFASRKALGFLGPINRVDPLEERNLLSGNFNNIGNETRLIHKYFLWNNPSAFLTGVRYYRGFTQSRQGLANDGDGPSFRFLEDENTDQSKFDFPSANFSAFVENLFAVSPKLSVTPGLRFEHIYTGSEGYYNRIDRHPLTGEILYQAQVPDNNTRRRSMLLAGVGVGYKASSRTELYGNISQNYRAINFNDIRTVNPNFVIDENIQDEKGYTADFGFRGTVKKWLFFDASVFYLGYQNRIGSFLTTVEDSEGVERIVRYRTNISDSRSIGFEGVIEADLIQLIAGDSAKASLTVFGNAAYTDARYLDSEEAAVDGNQVELVPPVTLKTGSSFKKGGFSATYQFSYTAEHFSDATNAEYYPSAIAGIIPTYWIMDLSLAYAYKRFQLETGANNFTNNAYFTRRATGYPGPGIIPSDGRNVYVTLQIKI